MTGRTLWQEALDDDLQRLGYRYQKMTVTWMLTIWRRGDEKMPRRRNARDQKRRTRSGAEKKSRQIWLGPQFWFLPSQLWPCLVHPKTKNFSDSLSHRIMASLNIDENKN